MINVNRGISGETIREAFFRSCFKSILPVFLSLIFFNLPLHAQITRYVSISGDDIGGGNVCADAESPCRTISQAVSAAASGDIIQIGQGIYTESITIGKSLSLLGSGQGLTIIQTSDVPPGNQREANERVILIEANLEVEIADVTIRHGRAFGGSGGGLRVVESSVTLVNVTFTQNSASFDGGGLSSTLSSLTLDNVIFENNLADNGGGMSNTISSPILTNVTLMGNSAAGNGGAIYNNNSNPVLANVIIAGNSAELGGGINNVDSSPTLTNVIFSGNKADMLGGGIRNSDENSNPVLTNVTFSGNTAAEGGGMANSSSGPVVVNSIYWNNEAMSGVGTLSASIFNDGPPGPTVSYSLIQGIDYSGENNLDGTDPVNDPLFNEIPDPGDAPTTAGDLRLQTGSPVIDMGDPDTDLQLFVLNDEEVPVDLDANPRVSNGRIDLGAYEYTDPTSVGYIAELPSIMELHQNYPNPFNPSTIIGYSLPEQTNIELAVFDLLGRRVAVLADGDQLAGRYEVTFNASGLVSGLYIYRLRAGTEVRTGRMTLLK